MRDYDTSHAKMLLPDDEMYSLRIDVSSPDKCLNLFIIKYS